MVIYFRTKNLEEDATMDERTEREAQGARDNRDALLTVDEIAARMKLKPSFFYAPVRRKGTDPIPCLKIGKYIRYRLSDVMAWIERQNEAQE